MRTARVALFLVLLVGLAAPLVVPYLSAFSRPDFRPSWTDAGRIGNSVWNTAVLAGLAVAIAVPAGSGLGIVLARGSVIGRRWAMGTIVVGMFLPLPVYAVAWQVILSGWIPPVVRTPGDVAWRPWAEGLLPAAWIHGVAAIPWVVGIVAVRFAASDRELEDEALLTGGWREVVRRVWLPGLVPAVGMSAVWVAVQCTTEIVVTDAMMVRTIAEEAYTHLIVGYTAGSAAAAVTTLPFLGVGILAGFRLRDRLNRFLPSHSGDVGVSIPFRPGFRFAVSAIVWTVLFVTAGLPLAALTWKAAGGGRSGGAELGRLMETLGRSTKSEGGTILESLLAALASGFIAAAAAWFACGLAVRCRWFSALLLVLCVSLWLTPGPLLGFGLKEVFELGMTVEEGAFHALGLSPAFPPVRSMVYDQPSPVPTVWAAVLRFFPLATAVVWPAVRAVPRDLLDVAALEGLSVATYFRRVIAPVAGPAFGVAAVAVAAMALGEVSASKIVTPPGYRAYVLELFAQMHYGTDATVCGLCLLQLSAVILVGLVLAGLRFNGLFRTWKIRPSPESVRPTRSG